MDMERITQITQNNKPETGGLIVLTHPGTLEDLLEKVNNYTIEVDPGNLTDIGRCSLAIMAANKSKIDEVKICCLGDLSDLNRLKELGITKADLGKIYMVGHGGKNGLLSFMLNGPTVNKKSVNGALKELFQYTGGSSEDSEIIFTNCYANSVAEYIKQHLNPKKVYGSKTANHSYLALIRDPTDIPVLPVNPEFKDENQIVKALQFIQSFEEFRYVDDIGREIASALQSRFESEFSRFYSSGDTKKNLLLLKSIAVNVVKCTYLTLKDTTFARLSYGLGKLDGGYNTNDFVIDSNNSEKLEELIAPKNNNKPKSEVENSKPESKGKNNEKPTPDELERRIVSVCRILSLSNLRDKIKELYENFELMLLSENFLKKYLEQEVSQLSSKELLKKYLEQRILQLSSKENLEQLESLSEELLEEYLERMVLESLLKDFLKKDLKQLELSLRELLEETLKEKIPQLSLRGLLEKDLKKEISELSIKENLKQKALKSLENLPSEKDLKQSILASSLEKLLKKCLKQQVIESSLNQIFQQAARLRNKQSLIEIFNSLEQINYNIKEPKNNKTNFLQQVNEKIAAQSKLIEQIPKLGIGLTEFKQLKLKEPYKEDVIENELNRLQHNSEQMKNFLQKQIDEVIKKIESDEEKYENLRTRIFPSIKKIKIENKSVLSKEMQTLMKALDQFCDNLKPETEENDEKNNNDIHSYGGKP